MDLTFLKKTRVGGIKLSFIVHNSLIRRDAVDTDRFKLGFPLFGDILKKGLEHYTWAVCLLQCTVFMSTAVHVLKKTRKCHRDTYKTCLNLVATWKTRDTGFKLQWACGEQRLDRLKLVKPEGRPSRN